MPPDRPRLERLFGLVRACQASLHDLSYVRTDGPQGDRVPRFNMPFEAGLALAHSLASRSHSAFLLEAKPYRLQRSLSDVNGLDPAIHRGMPLGAVQCVLGLLGSPRRRRLNARTVAAIAEAVHRSVRAQVRRGDLSGVFSGDAFKAAAAAVRELLGS